MIWSTMPGSSRRGLRPFHLQLPFAVAEFVDHALEHTDEDHVLGARVLQLVKPQDHLASVQAVSAADVFLPLRSLKASGCCSAQRNDNLLTAVMLSTNTV